MGFCFLLAGYFTRGSLERKGYIRFLCDRFLRLGVPLLLFIILLGPLTAAIVNARQGGSFWGTFVWLWHHQRIINGPMWFAQALLMFTLTYCAWRAVAGAPLTSTKRSPSPVPAGRWWVLSAMAVGIGALAIRQFVPTGKNVIGLQLGYFASYIFLFGLGIAAWRYDWIARLESNMRGCGSAGWRSACRCCRPRYCWHAPVKAVGKPTLAADWAGLRFSTRSGSRWWRGESSPHGSCCSGPK